MTETESARHSDANQSTGQAPLSADSAGLPTLDRYGRHLEATAAWLMRSIAHGRGGSCAFYSPLTGWSRPYPETTGYLIPTLLHLRTRFPALGTEQAALDLGRWLLEIQNRDGWWHGGTHPPRGGGSGQPSVFNTAQILTGLMALYRHDGNPLWLERAVAGASWLAAGIGPGGLWTEMDYRAKTIPSYYSYAVAPMLDVWQASQDGALREAAERALAAILDRRLPNGAFRDWGFREGEPAFTHTIAYTLAGLIEAARILDAWNTYGAPVVPALETLLRRAELAGGRLPGAFDEAWKPRGNFVCLTGNAQVASCLLAWERREPDLRLVNAAAKLVDTVCDAQRLGGPLSGLRGGVAGSAPVWGAYMRFRCPNWAARYHCDALMELVARVREEVK